MAIKLAAVIWVLSTNTIGASITKRAQQKTLIPAPLSVPPTSDWEGIDGLWNTFAIRIGTPPQVSRGVISTASQQIWTINPRACEFYATNEKDECSDQRGGLYYSNKSSTAADQGVYRLWIEQNLNYSGNAQFGYDSVGLGYVGEGMPTLKKQIVGALAVDDFWFGHFGLHPKTTNFTNITQNVPSYMTTLFKEQLIPSVSWGYTAGAIYRYAKTQASLTLGGYDKSRFIHNDVTFTMAPDSERDLLIYLNNITVRGPGGMRQLLPTPIYSFLDSTVPEIWLPLEACRLFELEFGLRWDTNSQLYFVNETQHAALVARNANVTFSLSTMPETQSSVKITLPYSAFDLTAKPPYRRLQTAQRYFPLRRAVNDTQYTLGRTFFQEAYLFADWERQTFTVSQCAWGPSMHRVVVPVFSTIRNTFQKQSISAKTIAGIVVGILLLLAALFALYLSLRYKRRSQLAKQDGNKMTGSGNETDVTLVIPKHELDAGTEMTVLVHEIDASTERCFILEAPENVIHELSANVPCRAEAGGRELSEKEAIRVREHRYNGTEALLPQSFDTPISPLPQAYDTTTTTNMSAPRSEHSVMGLSPISPVSDGTLLNGQQNDKIRRVEAAQVQIVQSVPISPFSEHHIQSTPGELLESSDGWSCLPERSPDTPSHHKRFSFEM